MKVIFLSIIILIITLTTLFIKEQMQSAPSYVIINHSQFHVTLAATEAEREQGLSKKPKMAKADGMLFLFPHPGYYAFWMKDMVFSLDMVFIRNNIIVTIIRHIPVPKNQANLPIYHPAKPADMVLEINAGSANNMKIGDTVTTHL
ncbi:MAG TPA: DUF192 domain-containing protein [Patescibacteria group bacterium]|nr:DUF192 domain-containing protein [Patescibacteria group bacterium]